MVGLEISTLKSFEIDIKFTLATFASKFLFYPIATNIFILFNKLITGWYNENHYNVLQLLSTAQLVANIIVIAGMQKFHPEKVATTVLLSLLFVLIYMPVMVSILLSDLG